MVSGENHYTMKYVAIIIEPRKHKAIEYVLNNVLESLNEDWNIVFFHGNQNKDYVTTIVNGRDRVQLVHLPVDNLTFTQYNELLATKSLIYDYATEMFLVFQTDSMIFVENKDLIHQFLVYDYVGAPWLVGTYPPTRGCGFIGNGGFSLRRKSKMLEIIEKIKWQNDNEDLYFCTNYEGIRVNKPSYEMAKTFSVEQTFSNHTFACHKPWLERHYEQFKLAYPIVERLRELQGVDSII